MKTLKRTKNGGRWPHAILWTVLATVVALPLVISGSPGSVEARKYGHKSYNYQAQIAHCQGKCGGKKAAILACISGEQKLAMKNCRADFQSCTADPTCKSDAKPRFHLCMKSARGQASDDRHASSAGPCKGCCRHTRGQGNCLSYFSGSRLYGSYRYHGHLNCVEQSAGGGTGGSCAKNCEVAAKKALAQCGKGKGGSDPNCQADVDAQQRACLARCTASPAGAFLPGVSGAIRAQLAHLAPWLVDGPSD